MCVRVSGEGGGSSGLEKSDESTEAESQLDI